MFSIRSVRPLASRITKPLLAQRKAYIHEVVPLAYSSERGLKPIFSPEALNLVYTKNQQQLIDRLNQLTVETEHENQDLFDIMHSTYKKAGKGEIFNHAAQAWNNDFFLQTLSPEPRPIKEELKSRIARDFGSFEAFQEHFTNYAYSLFGSGWTWLVEDERGALRIVNTFNAGNPVVSDTLRQLDSDHVETLSEADRVPIKRYNGSFAPLLTLNMWEHAYVPDFGPDGKEEYIKAFWKSVDWEKVYSRLFRSSRT
ncbi:manganese and iron superoxide dismutase [Basidiobolus meristosporus CBS 931.73]|uniref:Superoxide dismutase n=1 Tax=Basidiobolus meristosporus CBS 931.73 TaxID=1314790 RepID=A0A1Y1XX90_9FUNG|nr:manganese and iron superoxide dismutase [Basidiobolus meristosporus CBS 931.73]|eukprot:ORX90372.1 manganese and iron superoxide dismutase [Basidiobolus meristosporus CBS 931.73]